MLKKIYFYITSYYISSESALKKGKEEKKSHTIIHLLAKQVKNLQSQLKKLTAA